MKPHTKLYVKDLAQIKEGMVEFGDLTLIIGPQSSGKSIFLQLFKLTQNLAPIVKIFKKRGLEWRNEINAFQQLYFGEGVIPYEEGKSVVMIDEKEFLLSEQLLNDPKSAEENTFLIPAQRVLTFDRGYPKPYDAYGPLDPYVVKSFSEKINRYFQSGLGTGEDNLVFPVDGRMKK